MRPFRFLSRPHIFYYARDPTHAVYQLGCANARIARSVSTSADSISAADTPSTAYTVSSTAPPPATQNTSAGLPWKYPTRGGQDLSRRFARLERSLRGKQSYSERVEMLEGTAEEPMEVTEAQTREEQHEAKAVGRPNVKTFVGLVIPEKPRPPESDECCMSGCAVCVYDLYTEAVADYERSLDTLRQTLSAQHISESEWPAEVQTKPPGEKSKKPAVEDVALSAFEELERQLRERRETLQRETGSIGFQMSDAELKRRVEMAKATKSRPRILGELYDGIRWVLFSNR